MHLKTQITLIIGLASIAWFIPLYLSGYEISYDLLKPFSQTISVVTFLAVLFEGYLWKLPLINGLLLKRPPLAGTWRTELISNYKDVNGDPIKKTVYMVIDQTLTTLSVRMYTDKAKSVSITESIRHQTAYNLFELAIVYQNIPDIQHRQDPSDSSIHYGAAHLTDIPRTAKNIKGSYWTDRDTKGQLRLLERKNRRVSSYEEGKKIFSSGHKEWWQWF